MLLYLLRHANADTEAPSDDERFLSEKGMLQAQRVAAFCEARELRPEAIFTSPLRRAHQTGAVVADKLGLQLQTVSWLTSGVEPETMLAGVAEHRNLPSCMIVGHEPDFSKFAAYLIGLETPANLHIRKGSLTQLIVYDFREGGARLEFSVPAKLV